MAVYTLTTDLTRYVRTPAGVRTFHEPIGSPIGGKYAVKDVPIPGLHKMTLKYPKNPAHVRLNGDDYTLDEAVEFVGEQFEWPTMDKQGSTTPDAPSIVEQHKAQILAKTFDSVVTGDSPADKQYAASIWEQYQMPSMYGEINKTLRFGTQPGEGQPTQEKVQSTAHDMFKYGGYTTQVPMTVFRAMKSKRESSFEPGDDSGTENWAAKLKPGTVFTDKGIISTTAHDRFAQGWLMNDAEGNDVERQNPNDVVMEIHLPAGQRIVGGDPQFIETMLPPDTSLKIVSSTVEKGKAVNPLTSDTKKTFKYTHVVAEVIT